MNDLSSVNVAQEQHKKSKFDLSHDTNTTFQWGELQPINVRLIPTGGCKSVFSVDSLVRLSPLLNPTFGRIHFRTYSQFVPCSDIFWRFPEMLSDVPTTELDLNGEPVVRRTLQVPQISTDVLQLLLFEDSFATVYKVSHDLDLNATKFEVLDIFSETATKALICQAIYSTSNFDASVSLVETIVRTMIVWSQEVDFTHYPDVPQIIAPDSADFTIRFNVGGVPENDFLLCINYGRNSRLLRKILIGCGYKFGLTNAIDVSLMHLYAYGKTVFDIFQLPQYENWKESALYKLIHYQYVKGVGYFSTNVGLQWLPTTEFSLFLDYWNSLKNSYYTEDADFVSSHIGNTLPSARTSAYSTLRVVDGSGNVQTESQRIQNLALNFQKPGGFSWDNLDVDMLKKMYLWTNANSVIGYQIGQILRSMGYDSYVDDCKSHYIGSTDMSVDIESVTSTSDTVSGDEGSALGEYAGRSVGYEEGHVFTYNNDEPGFIITIACVVPLSGYNSALDPTLLGLDRFTFYNPQFEQLGFEKTPRWCVGHLSRLEKSSDNLKGSFGNIPRYSGYKVSSNILNGDMSRMSMFDTYGSYQMDKQIVLHDFSAVPYNGSTTAFYSMDFDNVETLSLPNADPQFYRRPFNTPALGMFNRIFNDYNAIYGVTENDNFLNHNYVHFSLYAPMLPIADTWQSVDSDDEKQHFTFKVRK